MPFSPVGLIRHTIDGLADQLGNRDTTALRQGAESRGLPFRQLNLGPHHAIMIASFAIMLTMRAGRRPPTCAEKP
jgi:hypothetical protein